VTVVPDPPTTVVGESVKFVNVAGVIVRLAVTVVLTSFAEIVAVTEVATADVVTLNVAEVAPAGIVTVAGGVALLLPDVSVTTSPPLGAGPLRVTVPVETFPPMTDVGDNVTLINVAGEIVKVAVFETVPKFAPIVARVDTATGEVVIVKVVEVDPAGTVTDA